MAVYVIADLHLSTSATTNKSMEVFGARWKDYTEKLRRNWTSLITPDDTVIIPGDISWALTLEEAKCDLAFINALPGKKVLMKGNHDFWWSSLKKMQQFCSINNFDTLSFFYHNALRVENLILCGTRGWFYDPNDTTTDSESARIYARETIRLDISLAEAARMKKDAPECELLAFFHFPPIWNGTICSCFTDRISAMGIHRCYFGHIHGSYNVAPYIDHDGVRYNLIAADYIGFVPQHIPQMDNFT